MVNMYIIYDVVGVKWDRNQILLLINYDSSIVNDINSLFILFVVYFKIGISNYFWCKLV